MSNETLRDLSRTYAAGDIDRDTYRLERRRLLERIASGEQVVNRFRLPEPEALPPTRGGHVPGYSSDRAYVGTSLF